MTIKITLFITMIIYAMAISQSLFYMLGLSKALRKMQPATFSESSQLLKKTTGQTISFVHYLALLACIALTAFCVTNPSGILFASSLIALTALAIELIFKPGSISATNTNSLPMINIRQVIMLVGFVSLLAGIILSI